MTDTTEAAGKLAGSAGVLIVRKVAGSLLGALSSVVVVRCLGPENFGQYAAGLAAYYLLLALTEFGFGEVLGRALGRGPHSSGRLGRLVLGVNLVWSAAVALAATIVAAFFAFGSIKGGTLLVMVPALALAGTTAVRQFFYAHHEVGRMAVVDLATTVASTVAVVSLAFAGASAVVLAACASAASVVNSLLILRAAWPWIMRREVADPAEPPVRAGRLMRDAFPIGFASFLATAYVSIDVVILSSLFPADLIGQYASAVKVLSILTIFPGLVMSVALPQLSADWGSPDRLGAVLARLWHWFMSLVLPALAVVAAQATGVMTVLFGHEYESAGAYLRILTLAGAISMFSQLLGVVVVASARAKWLVLQNIIALVLNVGGNLLIAPRFGLGAAAWLTVLTEVVVCGGSWLILRDSIPYAGLLRVSVKPVLAVLLAVAAGLPLSATPWLALSVSTAVYVAALSLLRGWPAELVRMLPRVAS